MDSPKSDLEGSSQENEWTVLDRPPRVPLTKSNTLSSMASSSLNALRRTRSRNDPPSGSNSADKVQSPPLAASARSNSWTTSLGRRASTKSSTNTNPTDSPTTTTTSSSSPGPGIDRDPPTPPSESSSSRSSASSHETVTPPASAPGQQQQQGARVLSTLATLASPSTYYKPAARLFRPSSSGSSNSRPSTAGSVKLSPFPSIQPSSSTTSAPAAADMTSYARTAEMSTEDLDKHADQLIRAALQRTKDANALARTESNASTSSQSRPTADSSPSSSTIHHSASAPAVIPLAPTTSRTSWFGFGGGNKEERRLAKEEKRGRKSRPTSEVISSPISGITSRPTSTSGRPSTATGVTTSHSGANTPIASPQIAPLQLKGSAGGSNGGNNFAAAGASLPSSAPIRTIREGVPFTHSLTVDSVMTTASEDRRGRARARSSSPFRAFRSSRSRGGAAKDDKEKEKEKKREKSSGRSPSPAIHALKRSESDAESDAESLGWGVRRKKKGVKVRRTAFDQRSNTGETEDEGGEDDDDEEEWSDDDEDVEDDDDGFDPETTQNTEANATPMDPEVCLSIEGHSFPGYDDDIELPDPLGEGVNVVRPEAPMFAQTLMAHTTRPSGATTSPTRQRAASPRSVNTGGSGGDDATDAKQRSSSMDGIGAIASSPTSSAMSPTTSSPSMGTHALTPAQVAARTPKKKKTIKSVHSNFLDPLPLNVSRPHFTRDRCTVVLKHGHVRERSSSNATAHPAIPEGMVIDELGNVDAGLEGAPGWGGAGWKREPKRYVVFSDMSEESKWAVEWGIGTVLRDGDEMILVTVQESDSKLDPAEGASVDRLQKLRNQQERQALASLLVRQATSLLQRTKLNVTVTCQAMHAKNARRLFLDIIDLLEPTMVIVGSRGLGKLKGILLGSTSHYLIQKSSVPVMVARRRLKRPTRKSHTAAQAIEIRSQKRVSLADARIEKMSSGQGKGATGVDVEDIQREHEQAEKEWPRIPGEDEVVVEEEEEDEEEQGANGAGAGEGEEQRTSQSPAGSSRADSPSAEKRAPGVSGKVAGE